MTSVRKKVAQECVESTDFIEYQPLLFPLSPYKSHTLVLDIDETLLSVRRWIDEVQFHDWVFHNQTNKELTIIKITKEVTLHYDDGASKMYSFYFDPKHPFAQLSSSLDIGDRMDIGARLASVKEILTSSVTVLDEDTNTEIEMNCKNGEYSRELQYVHNNERDDKFSEADLVFNNLYLVRFRAGLDAFFEAVTLYPNLEIVLWTAAVRKVYTGLMQQVHDILLHQMSSAPQQLWSTVLFRDNCIRRQNGSYFKDLSLLDRDLSRVIMIDNVAFNFEGYEMNGLPINEYWGHSTDDEIPKLTNIISDIMTAEASECDVRHILHRFAFEYDFSTFKLDQMVRHLPHNEVNDIPSDEEEELNDMESSLLDEEEELEQLDVIQMSQTGYLYNEKNFISETCSDGHNFAKGHYTYVEEFIDEIVDCIRNEAEECDDEQPFQLYHSLSGGTEPGLSTQLLKYLEDNYPDIRATFSVIPNNTDNAEPYNQVLTLHDTRANANADITLFFDNCYMID